MQAFERLIVCLIVINSVMLAYTFPSMEEDQPAVYNAFEWADRVILGVFTFEGIGKIVALGFLCLPGAYLRDAWNRLDFLIIVVGIVEASGSVERVTAFGTSVATGT